MTQEEIKEELHKLLDEVIQSQLKLKAMKDATFKITPEDFEEVERSIEIMKVQVLDLKDRL